MEKVLGLFIVCALVGCSSKSVVSDYYRSPEYQRKAELKTNLLDSDKASVSEANLNKMLNSKITLPKSIRLGVVRADGVRLASLAGSEGSPLVELKKQNRVRDVLVIPSMMLPSPITIPGLREAAARMQLDMVLLFQPRSERDSNQRVFKPDQVEAETSTEAVLLDVRTGVIPFTAATDGKKLVEKSDDDLTFSKTLQRAEIESEKESVAALTTALSEFISKMP